MSTCHSLSPTVFPFSDLSFFLTMCTIQPPVCRSPLFVLPSFSCCPSVHLCQSVWQLKVSVFLCLREKCCLTERLAFKCDRGVKRPTCMQTHANTHFILPQRACLCSQATFMKLLRQILERNSICRRDERCDRGEREERRMKGQEKERSRVTALDSQVSL